MIDQYLNRLRDLVNDVSAGLFDDLLRIETLDTAAGEKALGIILGVACTTTNFSGITAGRHAFNRLPLAWRAKHLDAVVTATLDATDDFEYRRLLELLDGSMRSHFNTYLQRGLHSPDPHIREAATDHVERSK